MKLLIVEDEARMAGLLHKGLTEEGHMATCAADGAEGLALAKTYEFDVIILDVMMPKLNGYDACRRIREQPWAKGILIVAAMMLWSDSTHLANFGTASLWPVYLFFGNQSKYTHTKPTSYAAHHVAYLPTVCIRSIPS